MDEAHDCTDNPLRELSGIPLREGVSGRLVSHNMGLTDRGNSEKVLPRVAFSIQPIPAPEFTWALRPKERVQVFTAGDVLYRYPCMVYPYVSTQMT
jgi:hypothetical protein